MNSDTQLFSTITGKMMNDAIIESRNRENKVRIEINLRVKELDCLDIGLNPSKSLLSDQ